MRSQLLSLGEKQFLLSKMDLNSDYMLFKVMDYLWLLGTLQISSLLPVNEGLAAQGWAMKPGQG